MILLVYRKDTGEILHYVEYGGDITPSLFGLYHASIKYNYPELKLDDIEEFYTDDISMNDILKYSKFKIENDNIIFGEEAKNFPLEPTQEEKNEQKLNELEQTVLQQQQKIKELIDELQSAKLILNNNIT